MSGAQRKTRSEVVFVFGSNLAGRHGAGAAKHAAEHYGAQYGIGVGRQGNSYAIPTKDEHLRALTLADIGRYVDDFVYYAEQHPDTIFILTAIGTGLAGKHPADIGDLFAGPIPHNIYFSGKLWEAKRAE